MCKTMQVIVDRERDDAEVARSKKIAWNMWKNGEHDLDKIAETTLLSAEQVREAITRKQVKWSCTNFVPIHKKYYRNIKKCVSLINLKSTEKQAFVGASRDI